MVATPGVTARLPESLFAAPRLWCEPPLSDAARPPALLPLDLLPDLRSSSSWMGWIDDGGRTCGQCDAFEGSCLGK